MRKQKCQGPALAGRVAPTLARQLPGACMDAGALPTLKRCKMPEENDKFYVYSGQDVAMLIEGILSQSIKDKDLVTFEYNCTLFEEVIFQARKRLAGIKTDLEGGGVLTI